MSVRLAVSELSSVLNCTPQHWYYMCMLPHPAFTWVLGMQAEVLCVPSTLTTKPSPQCSIYTCFNILELDSMVCFVSTFHKINRNKNGEDRDQFHRST